MTTALRGPGLLCVIAAFALSACGGGDGASAASTDPVPAPTEAPPPPPAGDFTLLSNIKYGEGATSTGSVDLLLDIYQPEATCTSPRPTIFYVHGGGFIGGDKDDDIVRFIAPLVVEEGFNFVSINYRLAGDMPVLSPAFQEVKQSYADDGVIDASNPLADAVFASFEDGVTALNWMEDNAATYCFDMNKLGYWGSSAGTFVTLQIAYALDRFNIERPEPRFVNAWWGVLMVTEDLETGEAPFLILHGEDDPVVPYEDSLDLAARADAVGVPYAFYTLVDARHGFDANNDEQTLEAIDVSIEFAVAQLTGGDPVYGRYSLQ